MSAKYVIKGETLTGIADAIRTKTGETATMLPTQMAEKIEGIESGIDTSDADATADFLTKGKTAYVNGQKITGTLDVTKVNVRNSDYDILFTIPSHKSPGSGTLVSLAEFGNATAADVATGKTFTSEKGRMITGTLSVPDLSGITATEGYVSNTKKFVKADGTLADGRLVTSEVQITDGEIKTWQVAGELKRYGSLGKYSDDYKGDAIITIETNDLGNASTVDVLAGKTFTGGRQFAAAGTMPNNGAVETTIDPMEITGLSEDVSIANGYHNGNGRVTINNNPLITNIAKLEGTADIYTSLSPQYESLKTSINTTQADLISQIVNVLEAKGYTV